MSRAVKCLGIVMGIAVGFLAGAVEAQPEEAPVEESAAEEPAVDEDEPVEDEPAVVEDEPPEEAPAVVEEEPVDTAPIEGTEVTSEDGEDFAILARPPATSNRPLGNPPGVDDDFAILDRDAFPTDPRDAKLPSFRSDHKSDLAAGIGKKPVPEEDPRVLDPWGSDAGIARTIREHRTPVDFKKLVTAERPVLFLGEDHTDAASQEYLIGQAQALRESGVTHLALEGFTEAHQDALDRYFQGDNEARKVLEARASRIDEMHPGTGDRTLRLIDAMREQGVRPAALESEETLAGADERNLQLEPRNVAWAESLARIRRDDPEARIVVISGSLHSNHQDDASANNQLRRNHGIDSTTVHFVGGSPTSRSQPYRTISRAGLEEGVGGESFLVLSDRYRFNTDAYLHVPRPALP